MLDNMQKNKSNLFSDSVRKGLIYTPPPAEDEDMMSFENKRTINYQHEYMRLYIANVVLTQQLRELLQEKGDLINKISKLEVQKFSKNFIQDSETKFVSHSQENNNPNISNKFNHSYQTRKIRKI